MISASSASSAVDGSWDVLSGADTLSIFFLSGVREVEGGAVIQGSESRSAIMAIQVDKWKVHERHYQTPLDNAEIERTNFRRFVLI